MISKYYRHIWHYIMVIVLVFCFLAEYKPASEFPLQSLNLFGIEINYRKRAVERLLDNILPISLLASMTLMVLSQIEEETTTAYNYIAIRCNYVRHSIFSIASKYILLLTNLFLTTVLCFILAEEVGGFVLLRSMVDLSLLFSFSSLSVLAFTLWGRTIATVIPIVFYLGISIFPLPNSFEGYRVFARLTAYDSTDYSVYYLPTVLNAMKAVLFLSLSTTITPYIVRYKNVHGRT